MNDDDLEKLGAMVDIMDSSMKRNVEAFELCAEVFNRMQAKKSEAKAKAEAKAKEKPTGRRAAVEHTKRKIEDGES